jgi:molybdopterin molybdotransferase
MLSIVGTVSAGHPFRGGIAPGEAVRIFTGAILPNGADTVVAQENVTTTGRRVAIPAGLTPGTNRRRAGEDASVGDTVVRAGDRLTPARIGLLASVGTKTISVFKPLRVAVFSTGDEIADGPLKPGQIHDSNRPVLLAMLSAAGIAATDLGILPDRADIIRDRLAEAARTHDAVACSAGMSVGDEDHVKGAVRALGALDFWSVAIKPGRPIAIGRVGDAAFFGLPGNPVAMVVTFSMIVRPALLRMAGAVFGEPPRFPVVADFALTRRPGFREFLRATLHPGDDGMLRTRRHPKSGSGVLSSVAGSDGFLEVAEDIAEIAPGMVLPFIPFSALGL